MKTWSSLTTVSVFNDVIVLPIIKSLIDACRRDSERSFEDTSKEVYLRPVGSTRQESIVTRHASKRRASVMKPAVLKSASSSAVCSPEMELETAENLIAERKMRQRLSFEETLIYIFGYIANLVSLWIISLAMFPGGLVGRNSNAKFLVDYNFRKPLFDVPVGVF